MCFLRRAVTFILTGYDGLTGYYYMYMKKTLYYTKVYKKYRVYESAVKPVIFIIYS